MLNSHITQERDRRSRGLFHRCTYCPSPAVGFCVSCEPEVPLCLVCVGSIRFHHRHETLRVVGSSSSIPPPIPGQEGFPEAEEYLSDLTAEDRMITLVACGPFHSFVVYGGKFVFGFGQNLCGQLGLGHSYQVSTPTLLLDFPPEGYFVKDVKCGRTHSVFVLNRSHLFEDFDQVWVCGSGLSGQLGIGEVTMDLNAPQPLQKTAYNRPIRLEHELLDRRRVEKLGCGQNFTMLVVSAPHDTAAAADEAEVEAETEAEGEADEALVSSSSQLVLAFGDGSFGQLGCGRIRNVWVPTVIDLPERELPSERDRIVHLACGGCHSLIVTERSVYTTGLNTSFQTGTSVPVCLDRFVLLEAEEIDERRIVAATAGTEFSVLVVSETHIPTLQDGVEEDEEQPRIDLVKIFTFGGPFDQLGKSRYIQTSKRIRKVSPQENAILFLSD